MYCVVFLDLSPRKFKSVSNNGKRRIAHDLPPYRTPNGGGITPFFACIWNGVPVPAIGAFYSYPAATSNLDSIPAPWSRFSSFDSSVWIVSSKNKAVLSTRIAFGKGGFVCYCHETAFFDPLFSFNDQYCRSLLEWKPRFCLFICIDARILFFGQAQSG